MPKDIERKLRAEVRRRAHAGHPVQDPDAYVYGTMQRIDARQGHMRRKPEVVHVRAHQRSNPR